MTGIAIRVQVFNISENQMIWGDTHLRIPHLEKLKTGLLEKKCYLVNKG